jgi:hypothetical protein
MNCKKPAVSLRKIFVFIILVLFVPCIIQAQYKLNFGLRAKQDSATLPHSKSPVQFPDRKQQTPPKTVLSSVNEREWILSGGWMLADANVLVNSEKSIFNPQFSTTGWLNATVPGTVLTTLVDQGIYPDPYFGLNNLAIPDSLCRTHWWYRISFRTPEKKAQQEAWLILNGINYRADVWLNGHLAGKMTGAFCRGNFKITSQLNKDNENILAIHIFPPPNPGIPQEESALAGPGPNGGQLCLDGPTFISSEGWDWVPGIRDRNIGIWQDVRLQFTGGVRIIDPQVTTDLALPDTSLADITVSLDIENSFPDIKTVEVAGKIENINFNRQITVQGGEKKRVIFTPAEFSQLHISRPRLWWPNGYGKPALYYLQLTVKDGNGDISDTKQIRFGIRELSYELTVDAPGKKGLRVEYDPLDTRSYGKPLFNNVSRRDAGDGVVIPSLQPGVLSNMFTIPDDTAMSPYLVIKVNGRRIFCKGGNWGMDDAMKRVQREHLEPYFRLHRDAGFTMVRNWTGESTEEVFYDLCDEYGLLVWNDFWLSTEGYNLEVNDNQLFLDNARDVIRRFRNHPSIAIWCPRNEGYAPEGIEDGLASLIASEDGTRHYQPNSRYMNLRPSGPWHYFTDPSAYYRDLAKGFNTEMGTPSIPTAESIRKMIPAADTWPISDTWYYHDLHNGQTEYLAAINAKYGKSDNLDDFCKKAQMVNYDSHRAMFESWNSRLWNNTSGLLLWMTHPAWPSMVWQVYSWDYETFGSYFGSKKACEPVHVQLNPNDNKVVVINTSLVSYPRGTVKLTYYNPEGEKLFSKEQPVKIAPNGLTPCFDAEDPDILPAVYMVRLELSDRPKHIISINDYLKTKDVSGNFNTINAQGKAVVLVTNLKEVETKSDRRYTFTLVNDSKRPAYAVKLNLKSLKTGETILPAYFSDGYFNLLPREKKQISVEYPAGVSDEIKVSVTGYNL